MTSTHSKWFHSLWARTLKVVQAAIWTKPVKPTKVLHSTVTASWRWLVAWNMKVKKNFSLLQAILLRLSKINKRWTHRRMGDQSSPLMISFMSRRMLLCCPNWRGAPRLKAELIVQSFKLSCTLIQKSHNRNSIPESQHLISRRLVRRLTIISNPSTRDWYLTRI